ncbi:RrF2 family transcriptional regulator [Catenovulum sediminis]|uniref:Rrf2 family transcriptional regulator n=1 Tax=Catenovulum sediminis TaxID=1740262 RepID=A0ABV1RLA3_9ALTE|nr:Rrf2 family transcriptional regulator [Catenovulum sediminis]
MQLTRFTDYSLRTLIFLAEKPPGFKVSLGQLAEFFNMNLNHLQKVSQKLVQLGYIESSRGKQGGISLAVDSTSVTLADIVRKMEPALEPVDCDGTLCPIRTSCNLRGVFAEAANSFMQVLESKTLADVAYTGPGKFDDLLVLEAV